MIEARGSIDARRYPKNLANLEAALSKLGVDPNQPIEPEEAAQQRKAGESGASGAYYLVVSALASLAAFYLGVTGFMDEHLVVERSSRGWRLEFDGASAQVASLGLIVFALDLAFTVYMKAAQKTFVGLSKTLTNLGWIVAVGLMIAAALMRS